MKKITSFIIIAVMTAGCFVAQGQTMKEVYTGLDHVKLYEGNGRFEVRSDEGKLLGYGCVPAQGSWADAVVPAQGNWADAVVPTQGRWEQLPPAMRWWLGEYDRELKYAKSACSHRANSSSLVRASSEQTSEVNGRKSAGDSVAPLINSQWRQYGGYNRHCPMDSSLADLGYHPTTGCVATAMAQIMRYWQWPAHGMGSMSYSHEGEYPCWRYGTVSADFANTFYDWDSMPQRLTDSSSEREIEAVSTLCYQCGVSVRMMYNSDCSGSSGAYSVHASNAFTSTFHYKTNHCLSRNSYSATQWTAILKNELQNSRPILYAGQSLEDTARGIHGGGHAFICDGYDTADYFHFNWGWGGYYDGYFLTSTLNPSGSYEFVYGQQAVVGVEPETGALAVPMLAEGIELTGEDFQMGGNVDGSYAVTNVGDTVYDGYIGVNVYSPETYDFYGWLDATEVHIQPGDTVFRTFSNPGMTRPVGIYYALAQYNATPLYITDQVDNALACFPTGEAYFKSVDTNRSELRNVTVCVSFADEDQKLERGYNSLRSDIVSESANQWNLHSYIYATTEEQNHLRTIMANGNISDTIITFIDSNSRGYYQPLTDENPGGYICGSSRTTRLNTLISNIAQALDESDVIDYDLVIDGDGDGKIDLLTIVYKNGEPIFESDSKPETGTYTGNVKVNARQVGNYTIINEQSDVSGHCYGALRMLGMPNMSHKFAWANVDPLGEWDIMDRPNRQQPSYILKHLYLNIGDEPTEISESGWYTIDNDTPCYRIINPDNDQTSYLLEMRNKNDRYDQGVPASGLTVARWNSEGDNNTFDNGSTPNQYWMMRPDSDCDTVQGNLAEAAVTGLRTYMFTDSCYFTIDSVSMQGSQLTFKLDYTVIEPEPEPMGIADVDNQRTSVRVYPNPTSGRVHVEAEGVEHIEVINATGQKIMTTKGNDIDLSGMTPGIYMLKIIGKEGCKVSKVMLIEH